MTQRVPDQTVPLGDRLPARKLTLKDAMALIAATGVGLALIRYSLSKCFVWEEPAMPGRIVYITFINIGRLVYGTMPVLFALCATVVFAGLRGPRPRRQEFATHRAWPRAPRPLWPLPSRSSSGCSITPRSG